MTTTRTLEPAESTKLEEKKAPEEKTGLFSKIIKGRENKPRRILLYGTQGIGKSTWASMAPNPIFLPTEDGLADIDTFKYPLLTRYEDFMSALSEIYTQDHEFKTLVVDSIDWLEKLIWDYVCEQHGEESIEGSSGGDFSYGKGYAKATEVWRKVIQGLEAVRSKRGMIVILLSHAKVEAYRAPDMETYDRYMPSVHKRAAALLCEWCDEVLFATWDVIIKTIKEPFNKERNQGIATGDRIVHCVERPSAMAKNRLGLDVEIQLDWREYAKHLNNSK